MWVIGEEAAAWGQLSERAAPPMGRVGLGFPRFSPQSRRHAARRRIAGQNPKPVSARGGNGLRGIGATG